MNLGKVKLTMKVPSDADYELQVYKETPNGALVAGSYNETGVPEEASITLEASTTYFVKVYKSSSSIYSNQPYELYLDHLPIGKDTYEPNNKDSQAFELTPGTSIESYLSTEIDFDIWKFTTGDANAGYVQVTMDVPSDADYDVQIFKGSSTSTKEIAWSYNQAGERIDKSYR